MAASILSQDILTICLFLIHGNIDLSMEKVIRRAENYQEVQDRHFGISRSDFRNLFHMLFSWELNIKSFGDEINDIKLLDIIPDILTYHDAHFNDEGEYWNTDNDRQNEQRDLCAIEYWFGYDEKKYQEKRVIKKEMERFFEHKKVNKLSSESVRNFMEEIKITEAILYYCSRSGASS